MLRKIDVSVDTFALVWAARLPGENNEDEIIARLARQSAAPPVSDDEHLADPHIGPQSEVIPQNRPKSGQWIDVLVWSLEQLGGKARLSAIYQKTREARRLFGLPITQNHEAAARERLESYCAESENYKGIANLFFMPEGKGAGVWALRL